MLERAWTHQVVRPLQIPHQCREFRVASVGLEELAHAPKVRRRKAPQAGHRTGQVQRKAFDHPLARIGCGQLAADVLADLPVLAHQLGIDSLVGPQARLLDQANHFGERCFHRSDDGARLCICLPVVHVCGLVSKNRWRFARVAAT